MYICVNFNLCRRYEKMISGMYLGEITRQLMASLCAAGALFVPSDGEWHSSDAFVLLPLTLSRLARSPTALSPFPHSRILPLPLSSAGAVPGASKLSTPWAFTTAMMSEIAEDTTLDLSGVGRVLQQELKIEGTRHSDRVTVQEVCGLVARRAARLSAAGVAAVLTQMGTDGVGVNVGFDGSVFKKYPRFQAWMSEALAELGFGPGLVMAEDGSGIGAALVAAVAMSGGAVRARA